MPPTRRRRIAEIVLNAIAYGIVGATVAHLAHSAPVFSFLLLAATLWIGWSSTAAGWRAILREQRAIHEQLTALSQFLDKSPKTEEEQRAMHEVALRLQQDGALPPDYTTPPATPRRGPLFRITLHE